MEKIMMDSVKKHEKPVMQLMTVNLALWKMGLVKQS